MGIIEIEENSKVGDQFRVILQPKIDIIGAGMWKFSEDSIRQIIEGVDALYFEWAVTEIRFPIIDNVKSVSLVLERIHVFNQAGQALTVLVSGLVGALAFAFILISVDKLAANVVESPKNMFVVLGAGALLIGCFAYYMKWSKS